MKNLPAFVLTVALIASSSTSAPAVVETVDLELVLAIDVSASINAQQARMQREGYVAALTDDRLIDRIRAGALGRIAVVYVEWSMSQTTVVHWTIIDSMVDAKKFSDAILASPLVSGSATSISGVIDHAVDLLQGNGIVGTRRVIDVSSDGRNTAGNPLIFARQRALNEDIVINGLPIVQRDANGRPVDLGLEAYYANNVIGGPGAFLVVAEGQEAFAQAIRKNLFIEIAGDCAGIVECDGAAFAHIAR